MVSQVTLSQIQGQVIFRLCSLSFLLKIVVVMSLAFAPILAGRKRGDDNSRSRICIEPTSSPPGRRSASQVLNLNENSCPLLLGVQAAEVAKQLLRGHSTDKNPDKGTNASDPNVPDDQVSSNPVSMVMPNQPALPRAGSHGVARCSAARCLCGVRRSCGTRQGESLAD